MQIQCPHCHEWTDAESGVCQLCGSALTGDASASANPRVSVQNDESSGCSVIIAVFIGILVVLGISSIYVFSNTDQTPPKQSDSEMTEPSLSQEELQNKLLKKHKAIANKLNKYYKHEIENFITKNSFYEIPVDVNNAIGFKNIADIFYTIMSRRSNLPIRSTLDTSNLADDTTESCLMTAPGMISPDNSGNEQSNIIKLSVRRDESGKYVAILAFEDYSPHLFGIFYPRSIGLQMRTPVWYGVDAAEPKPNSLIVQMRKTQSRQWEELVFDDPDLLKHFDLKTSKPMGSPMTTIRFVFPVTCWSCYTENYLYLVYREFTIDRTFQECYEKLVPSPIPGELPTNEKR